MVIKAYQVKVIDGYHFDAYQQKLLATLPWGSQFVSANCDSCRRHTVTYITLFLLLLNEVNNFSI